MDLDQYFRLIREVATELEKPSSGYWQEIEAQYAVADSKIRKAAEFRKGILVDDDYRSASGYLPIGYFSHCDHETRIALFTLAFEIGRELQRINCVKLCEDYHQGHPIFEIKPHLWDFIRKKKNGEQDGELLSIEPFKQFMDTELLEHEGLYFEVTAHLPPSILYWTREQFPNTPLFVRVNPYRHKKERIFQLNCEMLTPPSPNWWGNTEIYPNEKDGFSFFLENRPCSPEAAENFWEYNVKGLRKLQGVVTRRSDGYMSIMMEELSKADGDAYAIGRMIHLDTDARPGTDASKCQLNHLDLAVNYYYGEDEKSRMNEDLASGVKVTDASHRVHLMRVEQIPLTTLFAYVDQFFKSKIMKAEWRASLLKPAI